MGLRLVGLLPCAVWAPKVPKPTISGAQNRRTANAPYTVTSPNRADNCRCTSTTSTPQHQQQQQQQRFISVPQIRANVATTVPRATIAGPRLLRSATATATATATSATVRNPMLLVPFAVPGFVPVQPQQSGQPQQLQQMSAVQQQSGAAIVQQHQHQPQHQHHHHHHHGQQILPQQQHQQLLTTTTTTSSSSVNGPPIMNNGSVQSPCSVASKVSNLI